MKRLIIFISMVFIAQDIFAQGISFEKDLSWEQVKAKAKAENKSIFLDVMATWCGPCKTMEKTVFSDEKVGAYFNDKFISVKVQTDQTPDDSEFVKKWYADARQINQAYSIRVLPSFVFLTPNGDLAYQVAGSRNANALIEIAKVAIDPKNQYAVLLEQYFKGKQDTATVSQLIGMTKAVGRNIMAAKLKGEDFLNKQKEVKPLKVKSDFSGIWAINYPLCEFGDQQISAAPKEILIKQGAEIFDISRNGIDKEGKDYSITEVLPFTGKQINIPTNSGNRIKRAVLLDIPGNDLTEYTEVTYPDSKYEIEYTVTENWKLSEGGKRLTLDRIINHNTGEVKLKLVYDKK